MDGKAKSKLAAKNPSDNGKKSDPTLDGKQQAPMRHLPIKSEINSVLWVGNLDEHVTEAMLYELFLQVGPIKTIKIPKDTSKHGKYCYIQFVHDASVPYCVKVLDGTSLFGKKLKFQPHPASPHANQLGGVIHTLFTHCPTE